MRVLGCFVIIGMVSGCMAAANSITADSEFVPAAPLLATPYQPYKLKLIPYFTPPSKPHGSLIKVRIDGGPTLRMLLDSGAEYIVLDRKSAAKSGHAQGEGMVVMGVGKAVRPASRTLAGKVDFGDLAFRNCPLLVVDGRLAEGIDGIVPLKLFAGFQVRLDVARLALELQPYTEERPSTNQGFVKAHAERHLLFIAAQLEMRHEGYLLFDTGSSFNVISNATAAALRRSKALVPEVAVQAGTGATEGRLLSRGISFQLGNRPMLLNPAVALDMSEFCRRHDIEIFGVIGHPALSDSVVTVDYRDSMIRIASAREQRASR